MYNDKAKFRFYRGIYGQNFYGHLFWNQRLIVYSILTFTEVLCDLSLKDPLKNSWRHKSD